MNSFIIDKFYFMVEKSESNIIIKTEYGEKLYKCIIPDFMMDYLNLNLDKIKINLDSGLCLESGGLRLKFEETNIDKYSILEKRILELETQLNFQKINWLSQTYECMGNLSYRDERKSIHFTSAPKVINYFRINPKYKKLDLLKKSTLELTFSYNNLTSVKKFKLTENLDYKFEDIIVYFVRLDLVNDFQTNIIPGDYIIKIDEFNIVDIVGLSQDFILTYI